MAGASQLTPAQMADAIRRRVEGRPDITHMTARQRREAGLMTIGQAAQHEHLASVLVTRTAERLHGPDPDDPWALPERDETASWEAWAEAGHADCGSWHRDGDGPVVCCCGATVIPVLGKHIADSQPYPARNAVALAVADALGAGWVVAGAQVLRYNLGGMRHEVTFGPDVQYVLAALMDGETVQPFSFAIGEPEFSYVFRPAPPAVMGPVPSLALRPVSVLAVQTDRQAS